MQTQADAALKIAPWQAALRLACWFALAKLLFQFALTLWTTHLGYSYFRDEFYFLACGRHLAWGYVDHGPMVALQARLTTLLFGQSVFGIRVLSAAAGAMVIGLCGFLTWALGGGRAAQALAMSGLVFAGVYLGVDGFLSISSPEPIFWMGCILALLLLQRGASPRSCWLAVGACAGLGLLNKPSMLFFLAALMAALLLTPERRVLRTPWFVAAALLALLIVLPFLLWQVHHHWATWEFLHNGRIKGKNVALGPVAFLWAQIGQMQPVNALLWIPGLLALLLVKGFRPFRWIGVTYLLFLAVMMALHAKDYYLAPIYPMLFAAGAIFWEQRKSQRTSINEQSLFAFPVYTSVLLVTSFLLLPMASPVLPPALWVRYTHALHLVPSEPETLKTSALPQFYADRFGWQQMATLVVDGYRSLPSEERKEVCIITNNYGEAASLEFLGRQMEPALPPVISGHNNYWLWGMRGCTGKKLIAVVHDTPEELKQRYRSVKILGTVSDPLAMPYEHKNVYLLSDPLLKTPVRWEEEKGYI